MKTLYIHIGTPKTGSSAIQKFLCQNRGLLTEKGFCYPDIPFHYDFATEYRNGYFLHAESMENPKSKFEEGMEIVKEAFGKYPNVILSDEGIWFCSHKWYKKVAKTMRERGYQVKIIVYLRRQDEYMISRWSHILKTAAYDYKDKYKDLKNADNMWEAFLQRGMKEPTLDYGAHLKELEKYYGKENILVRRYDRSRFPDGSIQNDFLHILGLEMTGEYVVEKLDANRSLSQNTAEIQRVLNTVLTKGDDTNYENDMLFFRKILLSFSELSKSSYPCSMFSQEETKEFMEHYHEGNRRVAKEYFGEEELFSSNIKEIPKWEKNNPNMHDDMIRFMGMVCICFLEENRKIRQELHELKLFRENVRHPIYALGKKLSNRNNL